MAAKKEPVDLDLAPNDPKLRTILKGHAEAEANFLDSWNSGRLHHAWLITGPKGIGKATMAYRIARFILSGGGAGGGLFGDAPENLDLGPEQENLIHRMASGGHSDFLVLEKGMVNPKNNRVAENDIPVDIARTAAGFVRLTPAESDWRVVIVDAADDLNRNAANALLKVLEEPPARAVFLLVSHAPGRLLPTIRSRCRRLELKPLQADNLNNLLLERHPELEPAEAEALARLSEGSVGKAMMLAEQGGLDLFRILMSLFSRPKDLPLAKIHALGDQLGRKDAKTAYQVFRDMLQWWLNRLIRSAATGQMPPMVVAEEEQVLAACMQTGSVARWMEIKDSLASLLAKTEAPANLDRKQVIVSAFLTLETMLQQR
ncbi:DNA polymerase III subunit delta' [Aestuariispira insulae]|nr:DNA polymerase III subunit delta' [Aestuariispira insulae]